MCFGSCATHFHFKYSFYLVQQKEDANFQSDFYIKRDIILEV
jgi:hypothetical protein